jgi:hypothetical protein
MQWIEEICKGFVGTVIHRTHKSVDNVGAVLFDLPPLNETQFILDLYPHEYSYLDVIADGVTTQDAVKGTRFVEGGASDLISSSCKDSVTNGSSDLYSPFISGYGRLSSIRVSIPVNSTWPQTRWRNTRSILHAKWMPSWRSSSIIWLRTGLGHFARSPPQHPR